jgi:hypothetical protein
MDRLMGEVLPLDDLFSLIFAGGSPQDNLDYRPEFIRIRR